MSEHAHFWCACLSVGRCSSAGTFQLQVDQRVRWPACCWKCQQGVLAGSHVGKTHFPGSRRGSSCCLFQTGVADPLRRTGTACTSCHVTCPSAVVFCSRHGRATAALIVCCNRSDLPVQIVQPFAHIAVAQAQTCVLLYLQRFLGTGQMLRSKRVLCCYYVPFLALSTGVLTRQRAWQGFRPVPQPTSLTIDATGVRDGDQGGDCVISRFLALWC